MVLKQKNYGPNADSRRNEKTRLITLRNNTWEPITRNISLDESIGLKDSGPREVRLFHPDEEIGPQALGLADCPRPSLHR